MLVLWQGNQLQKLSESGSFTVVYNVMLNNIKLALFTSVLKVMTHLQIISEKEVVLNSVWGSGTQRPISSGELCCL